MASPKKPPSAQPPLVRPVDEVVRVNCRAQGRKGNGCGGQTAKVLFKQKILSGGTVIQYSCLSCNRPFTITF